MFGTGDFTVEAWLYPTSLSGTPGAWSTASSGGSSTCHALAVTSSNIIVVLSNTNVVTYGTPLATNTWSHVAVVRQGTTVYLFVNGFLVGTGTSSGNLSDTGLQFGAAVLSGWAGFTGKMAGMRVTKAARYTAKFTTPTTPFLTTGAL